MASTWRSWRVRKALDRSAPVPPVSPPHSASLGGALKRVSELAHPAKWRLNMQVPRGRRIQVLV